MREHTPGPWGYEADDGDWNITYALNLEHGPRRLAKVFDYANEFQEEDARLIAAAPELYEAGKRYMESVKALFAIDERTNKCFAEGSPTKDQETYERFVAFNKATTAFSAALAKARGEA